VGRRKGGEERGGEEEMEVLGLIWLGAAGSGLE